MLSIKKGILNWGITVCVLTPSQASNQQSPFLSFTLARSLSLSLFGSLLGYLYLFLTYLPFVPFLSTLLLSSLYARSTHLTSPSPSFYFSFTLFPFSPSSLIFLLCPSSFVLEKCHRQSAHPLTLLVAIHLLHHAQHLHFIAPNAST